MAYLAHEYLGNGFGSLYDLSTIAILWFAGASAMAGLLNIVPRYLPRYGMAPDWTRAPRPLVLIYTAIAFIVTMTFQASVEAQGGAYATGVLVLMSSAAFATTLALRRRLDQRVILAFSLITLVFFYTTITNIIERPDGVKIAAFFITAIVALSLISRVWRSLELRAERVDFDPLAEQFMDEDAEAGIRLVAHRPREGTLPEYERKDREVREDHQLSATDRLIFLEISISNASDFTGVLSVQGQEIGPYRILRVRSAAVPNAIAAILLKMRDETQRIPHAYFGWSEGNPVKYLLRFLLFGEGDTAIVTREVLRQAERDPDNRPSIHVGG